VTKNTNTIIEDLFFHTKYADGKVLFMFYWTKDKDGKDQSEKPVLKRYMIALPISNNSAIYVYVTQNKRYGDKTGLELILSYLSSYWKKKIYSRKRYKKTIYL
jgi:hypothetical protein